jgi:hypothetical protein
MGFWEKIWDFHLTMQWWYESPSAVTIAIVVPANIVGVRKVAMQDIGVDAHFRQRS